MYKLRYDSLFGELMLLLAFVSIFNKPLMGLIRVPLFALIDEILLLISLFLLGVLFLISPRIKKIFLLTIGFLVYSIVISLLFGLNRNVLEITLQSLINVKFLIMFLAYYWIFKDNQDLLSRFFKWTLVISVAGLVLNIVLGTTFNDIFGLPPFIRPTGAIRYGGFVTPNHMAFLLAMFSGFWLKQVSLSRNYLNANDWAIIFAVSVGIIFTDSRSAMLGVAIFLFFFYKDELIKNAGKFIGFIALAGVLIFLIGAFTNLFESTWINIMDSLSQDSYYIRGIMINLSTQLSVIFFPIGSGAATFGSKFSDGSPVYELLGVAHRIFFVEQAGIYDSNVASLLGEYGIIGSVFYVYIFICLKRFLTKDDIKESPRMLNGLFWVFAFYTLTNPTLTNNVYILVSIPVFSFLSSGSSSDLKEGAVKTLET